MNMNSGGGNRQIARNLIFNIGAFLINLGINFLLTPYLIRTVGKEAYSFFPLIGNMVGYTQIITAAVSSMCGRFISMAFYRKDFESAQGYLNSVLFANWILSLFFGVIFLVCIIFLPDILTIPNNLETSVRWMFGLSGVSLLLGLCFGPMGIGAYVKNRIDISSSRSFITHLIYSVSIVGLFFFLAPDVALVSVAALISAIFGAWFNVVLKKQLLPELKLNPLRYHSWKQIKELVSSGIWNSINQLSNVLLTQIDLLITNIFISVEATGDYALVKLIPNFIYSLLIVLSSTFTPNFNILYAQNKIKLLVHEINKSMKIVGILICVPIGFLLVFSDEFFNLWVPSQDCDYLYKLSFITVLPMIFGSSINPIFGVFSITNKLRIPSLVLLGAGVVNTLTVFILLKTTSLGIWSIPIVGAIQHGIRNFFFSPMYAAKCLNLRYMTFYPTVIRCVFALLVVVISGVIVKFFLEGSSWHMLIIEGLCVAMIALPVNIFVILSKSDRTFLRDKLMKIVKR